MKMLKILLVFLVVLALAAGPALAGEPTPQTICPVWAAISIRKSLSITRGSASTSAAPAVKRN